MSPNAPDIGSTVETGGPSLDAPIQPTPSAAGTEEVCPSRASSDRQDDEELLSDTGPARHRGRARVAPSIHKGCGERRELAVPAWLTWAGASAMGGLMTSLVLLLVRPAAPEPAPNPTPWLATPEEVAPFAPDAGVGEEALASVENMLPGAGPFVVSFGRPMPSQPFPSQRRPPCVRGEREINGGCWIKVDETEKPPCGDKMFDYEGRCFFASFNGTRQPTSDTP